MKSYLKALLSAIIVLATVSCSGIAIQSIDTKYGKLTTNLDGSQSFTTKPIGGEEPIVVGTVKTNKGNITVNPDGSYVFTSKPAALEITPEAIVVEESK